MPYSVSIQSDPRVAHVRVGGALTPAVLLAACRQLVSADAWAPGTPQVWDFSDVTTVQASPEGWAALLAASRQRLPLFGANRSAAVTRHETLADLLRVYAFSFRGTGREFFLTRSRWEAVTWLLDDAGEADHGPLAPGSTHPSLGRPPEAS